MYSASRRAVGCRSRFARAGSRMAQRARTFGDALYARSAYSRRKYSQSGVMWNGTVQGDLADDYPVRVVVTAERGHPAQDVRSG